MKWRHKKRGTTYEIVFDDATLQTAVASLDNNRAIVYRCLETGNVWVRPASEFFDGRFEPVPA